MEKNGSQLRPMRLQMSKPHSYKWSEYQWQLNLYWQWWDLYKWGLRNKCEGHIVGHNLGGGYFLPNSPKTDFKALTAFSLMKGSSYLLMRGKKPGDALTFAKSGSCRTVCMWHQVYCEHSFSLEIDTQQWQSHPPSLSHGICLVFNWEVWMVANTYWHNPHLFRGLEWWLRPRNPTENFSSG